MPGAVTDEPAGWLDNPAGYLLDIHADTEHDSLWLLALTAKSTLLQTTGHSFDCAVTGPGPSRLTAATSHQAAMLAGSDQKAGDGPASQALTGRLAVIVNAHSRDQRWPQYREQLRMARYGSVAAAPLQLAPGQCAAMTLFAADTSVFTPAVLGSVLAFSALAAKSLAAAVEVREARSATEHLRSTLRGSTSIDVACGVIMAKNRCSYQEAFDIVLATSSHHHLQAGDVADSILKHLPGGSPPAHFGG
jgi:ANTAR domain